MKRILTNILVIVLLTLAGLVGLARYAFYADPEIYLLPQGYTGRVAILFNQAKGAKKLYENGARVYIIPKNGLCLTQFQFSGGFINRHYYYVDSNGKRTELPIVGFVNIKGAAMWVPPDGDRNKVGILGNGTTSSDGELFMVSSLNDENSLESFDSFNSRINKALGRPKEYPWHVIIIK